jgi:hypothetical protein
MNKYKNNSNKRIPLENLMLYDDGTSEEWREGTFKERAEILKRLPAGKEVCIDRIYANQKDLSSFNNIIKALQEGGLDLDKGNAEYGYRMPLPKNNDAYRELIIFRRNEEGR